jgi:hypothetical protein
MVFVLEVVIEAAELFPLHDCQHGIQCVELGDLDVGGIEVVRPSASERDAALVDMVALLRRARCHAEDAADGSVGKFQSHPDIDKRNAEGLQLFHYGALVVARIHTNEREGDAVQQMSIRRIKT